MRGVLAVLIVALATIDVARMSALPECADCELAFTIQIHDYASVPTESLSRARDIVSRLYERIRVRTEWIGVLRPGERRKHTTGSQEASHGQIGQVTLIILTPRMAARGHVADGVLGYAAVPEEGMGRIAYVIYDRVRQSAAESATNEVDLLGFVMAHEISHLLLPRGSHSESKADLMKGRFEPRELRQLDVRKMAFSTAEANHIRQLLEDNATTLAANAARANSNAQIGDAVPVDPIAHDTAERNGSSVGR
jgi:hypothetical protein